MRATATAPAVPAAARSTGVDDLKLALAVTVILGHVAMTYGAMGSWMFEAPDYGAAPMSGVVTSLLEPVIALGALFAMGLFFLIAGCFSVGSLARKGRAAFAASRVVRLGTPVVVYVVVVVPALDVLVSATVGASPHSVGGEYVASLEQLGAGPMWFVATLLVFSLVLAALAPAVERLRTTRDARLRMSMLAVAAACVAGVSFAVRLVFPVDSEQVFDLHVWLWPQCLVLFAVGVLTAGDVGQLPVDDGLRRRCGRYALAAAVGLVAVGSLAESADALGGGLHAGALVLDALEGVYAVAASVWLLATFQAGLRRPGWMARRGARNTYGAYIAQGPVLVGFALALEPIGVSSDVKLALLAVLGTPACFLLADLARRAWVRRTAAAR